MKSASQCAECFRSASGSTNPPPSFETLSVLYLSGVIINSSKPLKGVMERLIHQPRSANGVFGGRFGRIKGP